MLRADFAQGLEHGAACPLRVGADRDAVGDGAESAYRIAGTLADRQIGRLMDLAGNQQRVLLAAGD
jgi:hypothetical protein